MDKSCFLYIFSVIFLDEGYSSFAILRSALEQKKAEEIKEFGPIDYDAPIESEKKTIGLGTKVKLLHLFGDEDHLVETLVSMRMGFVLLNAGIRIE